MNRIDFDLIVNELNKSIAFADSYHEIVGQTPEFYGPSFFREFRTIALTVARQTGKSRWLAEKTEKDSRALLIVRDTSSREQLLRRHQEAYAPTPSVVGLRVRTLDSVRRAIEADELELYDTFYIDDASFVRHFIENKLFRYLFVKKHFKAKFVLVG